MMQHLFTLVWNRKRSTLLVMLELFFCFLVLCALFTFGSYLAGQYRHPLGFSYDRVWLLSIEYPPVAQPMDSARMQVFQRLLRTLQASGNVEAAAGISVSPFSSSSWNSGFEVNGRTMMAETNVSTESLRDVLNIRLAAGRWFRPGDEALDWAPVVINRHLATDIYGEKNPLGQFFPEESKDPEVRQRRVIGVIQDFRQHGRLSEAGGYFFEYASPAGSGNRQNTVTLESTLPLQILLRVAPGTSTAFEEQLLALARAEAPDWEFKVASLAEMYDTKQKNTLIPLLAGGIIAVFFLLMVALGLVGVIWQNVTRRTGELGLRRAVGATTGSIYRQVLGELLALTTFSLLAGLLVAIQFPLLDLIGGVSAATYGTGFFIATVVMYGIALVCGLYPAVLATRIQPTEALHYE